MTVVNIQVVNPKQEPVTVDNTDSGGQSYTVPANDSVVLALDNTTADAWEFLELGCVLVSDDESTHMEQQDAGWLLYTGASSA